MKKIKFMMAAAVTFMAIGCTKENIEDKTQHTEQKVITFSAGDESVKSVLDGKSVKWQKDDRVAIYDGVNRAHMFTYSTDMKFVYNKDTYNSNADFTLSEEATYYAVYPYLNDSGKRTDVFSLTTDGVATITTFLASRQMPKPNTFATAADISACVPTVDMEKQQLSGVMRNLCGYIKFSIETAENIAYVKFTSNSNRKMSGRCDVIFRNNGEVVVDGLENQYVYCSSETGGAIAKGTYYVAVVPEEHANGINIMVTTTNGEVYEYNTGNNINVVANDVLNMGAIDSKMSQGASGKLSLLLDFVGRNTNITEKTSDYTDELTLKVNSYDVKVAHLYANDSGLATWNPHEKGYVKTPAIEGMILKNVVATFRGHTSNSRVYLRLWTMKNDGTADKKYSGVYSCVNNPTGAYSSRYAIPTMYSRYALRISHVLEPRKKTSGQDQGDPAADSPEVAAETSYMLMNESSGPSLVESIELVYEPVLSE
jgi:hypothetical protein